MIRINLIPPEITQRRRTESRLAVMILFFIVVMAVMVGFFFVMNGQVNKREREVANAQQVLEETQAEAERLKVFEDTVADLQRRQDVADKTLAGRITWSRLCQELSLVLPDDTWLSSLSANQESGLTLVGRVLDYQDDVPDSGHKAIARTLVRLADLEQLYDVWLLSSVKSGDQEEFEESWLDFQVKASVLEPEPEPDEPAEGDTAPPADAP